MKILATVKGGPGSGNWGHAGRPGLVGGSSSGAGAPVGMSEYRNLVRLPPDDYRGGNAPRNKNIEKFMTKGIKEDPRESPIDWTNVDDYSDHDYINGLIVEAIDAGRFPDPYAIIAKRGGFEYEEVSDAVGEWNGSGNGARSSLLLQQAIADEFGLQLSDWQQGVIKESGSFSESALSTTRRVVRTMYDYTQSTLAKHGIGENDTVLLMRGASEGFDGDPQRGDIISYHGNAAESWTTSYNVAMGFGTVLAANVPRKAILATGRTGMGTISEMEFIVMGNDNVNVKVVG